MRLPAAISTCALILLLAACDHGLSPDAGVDPGFTGTVRINGPWPPEDSVRDLRVVAFRNYPPKDILSEVIEGSAMFSESMAYGFSDTTYTIQDATLSGSFSYVVVAQNYGGDVFNDWRAVGVYALSGDPAVPTPVSLGGGDFVSGIDIEVDFYHLPPQPF